MRLVVPSSSRHPSASVWLAALFLLCTLGAARPASAATNTQATQKAIHFLSTDVATWTTENNCIACHRQGAAVFGLANAKANGYDMAPVTANGKTILGNLEFLAQRIKTDQLSNGSWVHEGSLYPNEKSSYAAFGLAGYDQNVSTQYSSALVMAANWALPRQQASGRWVEDHINFPVDHGSVPTTSRFIVALAQAKQRVDPAKAAAYQTAIDRAAAYLRTNLNNADRGGTGDGMPYTFQASWAIVGLNAAGPGPSGANTTAIATLATRLLTTATSSGKGWGNLPGEASTDFATGLSVYALCLAGREPATDPRLFNAIEWLKSRQATDGSWGSGTASVDIPTTFASLGLACFGDFSVDVSVVGADRRQLADHIPTPQQATYTFRVKNHGYQADTYTLSTQGGLPGWTATLDRTTLFLASGAEGTVTLTVTAPANLMTSLASEVSVIATSGGAPGVSDAARVTTFTPPEPPVTGRATTTTILSPAPNSHLTIGGATLLSARVVDALNNVVSGPERGVVTFFVAGVAIGADDDADGNGVFELPWQTTTDSWSITGPQDYRAVYSGVTLPSPMTNLLGSTAAQTLIIDAYPYITPEVIIGNQPAFLRETTLTVWGFAKPRTNGAVVTYAAFIVNGGAPVVVVPEVSGGLVFTPVELVEGPNIIQLTARDNLGGITTKQINLTVDRVPPVITIQSPLPGAVVGASTVDVTSLIDEQTPTRVETQWVNSTTLEFGSGTVTHTVSMPNFGEQGILVRATDSAGNVTEAVVHVFVDAGVPSITTDPADGAVVGPRQDNVLEYTVRVSSASATTVRVNGSTFTLPRGGGEVRKQVTLVAGTNTLTIDATNEAGRTTGVTRTVRYDTKAPTATLLIPTPGGTVGGIITLTARVTDDFSSVRGVGFSRDMSGLRGGTLQSNGTWTAELDTHELLDGTHSIDVWMDDSTGNFAIQSFSFTVKNNP